MGTLNNIQANLLSQIRSLQVIVLKLDNLKDLFQKGNEWITDLNGQINVKINNSKDLKRNKKLPF